MFGLILEGGVKEQEERRERYRNVLRKCKNCEGKTGLY